MILERILGISFLVLPSWHVFAYDAPLKLVLPFLFYGIILLLNSRKKIEAGHKTTARNLELVLVALSVVILFFSYPFAILLSYFWGNLKNLEMIGLMLMSTLGFSFFCAAVILGLLRLKRNK